MKTGTIESNLLDAGGLGSFGNQLADVLAASHCRHSESGCARFHLHGGSRRQNAGAATGENLGGDMQVASMHREAHNLELRNLGAGFTRPA
jgi:hypothetical protein